MTVQIESNYHVQPVNTYKNFDTDYVLHMVYIIVVSGSMDLCMMKTFNYFRNFSAEKWRKYKYIGPSEQFIAQRVK